jgi:ribosomal 50S subunit-associated protein YjgA (DUF615 family)
VDKAVVDDIADEEKPIAPLSRSERKRLAELLRKLLLSEPFRALDPAPVSTATASRARRRRRRAG